MNPFYLWSIIIPRVFYNNPYAIARFLVERVVKPQAERPIYVGYFVTRLVKSHGILDQAMLQLLTLILSQHFTVDKLETMLIVANVGGGFIILTDDPVVRV